MKKEAFEILLTDLYGYYNTSKIKDIPMLVNKYNGREFEGIKSIFIIYNSRYNQNYNAEYGTDNHIKFLINKYSNNERVFSKEALEEKEKEKLSKIEKKQSEEYEKKENKIKQIGSQLKNEIEEAVDKKIEEYFATEKEEIDKRLNELFVSKSEKIEKFFEDKRIEIQKNIEQIPETISQIIDNKKPTEKESLVEVKLTFENFGERDLVLPDKKVMEQVSIGERMVVKDSQGNICGIAIKDITYDTVSFDNKEKYIKDITIEKLT